MIICLDLDFSFQTLQHIMTMSLAELLNNTLSPGRNDVKRGIKNLTFEIVAGIREGAQVQLESYSRENFV